ncbi:glycoside hydrolase family 2 TIM barrel-domain containing protein [Actinoplanes sp. NPDC051411]|uniref:glycoside hydrolase family 2 TIM barrel-domain containing protein n=1 Tax=Actinoplanes sp. NPDC051411 TaxID=3155522 RepID=UPI003440106B
MPDESRDRGGSTQPGLTRRRALQVGAVTAGTLVYGLESAAAQAAPDTRARERSFDEDWRFFRGDVDGGEAPELDDSAWRALDLPHDWSVEDLPYAISDDGAATSDPSLLTTQVPPAVPVPPAVIGPFDPARSAGGGSTGYTVGGIGWYRKHFRLPGDRSLTELRFDGVYQNADVWLNGVHLGFHPFGYTGFAYDLTPHLNRGGTNVLAVRVDNSGQTSRWYSGSGIYRHTWLTVTGPVRIALWGIAVTTPEINDQQASVRVEAAVTGTSSAHVRVTVLDPNGRTVARGQGPAGVPVDLVVARPARWSPESPNLYTARAEVITDGRIVDTAGTRFGIRTLRWDGEAGFELNGKSVKIVGGCIHHDNGPMGAVALDRSEERRVQLLKAAGFNALRTAHNPPSPALLDACDRLGMLVMDEFADVWDTGKTPDDYSVHFAQWWQRDLTSMILRDRNHPSVVIWSLGNEITDNTGGQRGAELAAHLRSLDRSRPITLGGGSTFSPDDPSWSYVDVGDVHYNANGKGYAPMHAAHPERAMTQSEGFPATIFQDTAFVESNDWAVGSWVWAAMDYLGESGIGKTIMAAEGTTAAIGDQSVMPGWSTARTLHHSWGGFGYPYPYFQGNCGDLDLIGQRKPQNHWRAAVSGRSPVELLVERPVVPGTEQVAAWWGYYDELESWTWTIPAGHPMTVRVYTPGDDVRVLLNGAVVAHGTPERCAAVLTVPYRPGTLTAVASRSGREIGRRTLHTVGAPAALRLSSDVPELTTSRDDLAHVLVSVVDRAGRLVPDAVNRVSFTAQGAGSLVAVGNGNPHNVDSFRRPRRHTWHGRALAILRPAADPGTITLTASTPGLSPATLRLRVHEKTAPHVRNARGKGAEPSAG